MNNEHTFNGVIELRHLRLIDAMARGGTMTRAATLLNLTQSALSHQLKDVEDKLGMVLFTRHSRRMTLTAAGERMLSTAQAVLAELTAVEHEVRRRVQADRQLIRISTGCYTCYHWLPPRIREMRRRFPLLDVDIVSEYTRRPIEGILRDAVDLALVAGPVRNRALAVDFLFRDELMAVVAADHPLAGRPYLDAQTLANETLILYNVPERSMSIVQDVLRPAGLKPRSIKRIEVTEGIIELVRAGLGVGCLASWAVRPYLRDDRLRAIRMTRRGFQRSWFAATRRRIRQEPHIDQLIRLLQSDPL